MPHKTMIVKYRVRKISLTGVWIVEKLSWGAWDIATLDGRMWRRSAIRLAKKLAGPTATLTESWESIYDKSVILTFTVKDNEYRRMS